MSTYKIRRCTNGATKTGTPFHNYSLTVPREIAESFSSGARFDCELIGRSIVFRSATSPAVVGATGAGDLARQVMFDDAVIEHHQRVLRIPSRPQALRDLQRLLDRAAPTQHPPDWAPAPNGGSELLIVGGWLALIVVPRDLERSAYRGPDPKPYAVIRQVTRDLQALTTLDGLSGWALPTAVSSIPQVRANAESVFGRDGWRQVQAAVADHGVAKSVRPTWIEADRDGEWWITATVQARELALLVRPTRYPDGPRFTVVSLEFRPQRREEARAVRLPSATVIRDRSTIRLNRVTRNDIDALAGGAVVAELERVGEPPGPVLADLELDEREADVQARVLADVVARRPPTARRPRYIRDAA